MLEQFSLRNVTVALGAALLLQGNMQGASALECPTGTFQPDININVCVANIVGTCPSGTTPAFAGSEICLWDPATIPKYTEDLVIPPVMPDSGTVGGVKNYEIAVRQFQQQILPLPRKSTTVWSYGSVNHLGTFNYPAFTVENQKNTPTRVKWINDLVDASGTPLKHLLPVDQTLHWANPARDCLGGMMGTDCRGKSQEPYLGPVPIVPHVHGAHVGPESDGYPEAWWLPGGNIPAGYAKKGKLYDQFDRTNTSPGSAVFQYPNTQPPSTLWYHDHTLGMTRSNVYAGPAGFWLIRGAGEPAGLPGPAPRLNDPVGTKYYEIPLAIQDRSFNPDGSLFYPPNRAFFEGVNKSDLTIPFIPALALGGFQSDVSPIWNPEAFFNTMVVNGKTWPKLSVEPRRYRFRLLNGCNSRFLNLALYTVNADGTLGTEIPFYQFGAEGGSLPKVVKIQTGLAVQLPGDGTIPGTVPDPNNPRALLMGNAERADVMVDFSGLPNGTMVRMINTGPDEPFGGFPAPTADPETTGQVMQFVVDLAINGTDSSTAPEDLTLSGPAPLVANKPARRLSLNEEESKTACVEANPDGTYVIPIVEVACGSTNAVPFGPTEAHLGTVNTLGNAVSLQWMDSLTENPILGDTEVWELYNFTADAHPIHLHLVQFEVINRQDLVINAATGMPAQPVQLAGTAVGPEPTEMGFKDTVIAYPGQVTRIIANFDLPGLYVWHCHIVEHEDNEMMRPYVVRYTPDINGDGRVDRTDLNLAFQALAKRLPYPGSLTYDLNGDGAFNSLDLSYLVRKYTR